MKLAFLSLIPINRAIKTAARPNHQIAGFPMAFIIDIVSPGRYLMKNLKGLNMRGHVTQLDAKECSGGSPEWKPNIRIWRLTRSPNVCPMARYGIYVET